MTDVTFNFEDYYKRDFIDPLYRPYLERRMTPLNPYTINANEIRYNQGYDFKLKHSFYPCPIGFQRKKIDYCERISERNLPLFYLKDQNKDESYMPKTNKIFTSIYPL